MLFLASIFGMIGMFVYHPFFRISKIQVNGVETITPQEIEQTIYGAMDYHKWFLFPASSFFFVDASEVESILNQRFPLNTVAITKQFPHTLTVLLQERLSTILYDNGDAYHFIGLTGKVVEPVRKVTDAEWWIDTEIVTSTNERGEEVSEKKEIARHHRPDMNGLQKDVGEFPLIVDTNAIERGTVALNTDVIKEDYISQVLEWYEVLLQQFDLTISYVDVSSPYRTVIFTNAGLQILIALPAGESIAQIDRFRAAYKEISDISVIGYIDVRYPGKIYWQ